MTTISGLTGPTLPLSGSEVLPGDILLGGATERMATGDIANLAELWALLDSEYCPSSFDAAATYLTSLTTINPKSQSWSPPTLISESGTGYPGYVSQATGLSPTIYTRTVFRAWPTRILMVEADVYQVSAGSGETPYARVGMASLNGTLAALTNTSGSANIGGTCQITPAGQVTTIRSVFGYSAPNAPIDSIAWADPTLALYLRPYVRTNKSSAGADLSTSVANVHRLQAWDVTAELAMINGLRSTNRLFNRILRP